MRYVKDIEFALDCETRLLSCIWSIMIAVLTLCKTLEELIRRIREHHDFTGFTVDQIVICPGSTTRNMARY